MPASGSIRERERPGPTRSHGRGEAESPRNLPGAIDILEAALIITMSIDMITTYPEDVRPHEAGARGGEP